MATFQSSGSRPVPAFLAKMAQANQNIICTAKGDDVRRVDVAYLLQRRLRIPIFQRRYTWGEDQWATLLGDVMRVVAGGGERHSLGRITCVVDESAGDGRLLVVDGQQRSTTCSLLLAALRDLAAERCDGGVGPRLVRQLDAALFPSGLEDWLSHRRPGSPLEEGAELPAAALVPTYCDRASYFAAALPPRAGAPDSSGSWLRPVEAKRYFAERLRGESDTRLAEISEAIMHRLEWLFFPINLHGNHKDGTEDLHLIFERLALRDATFTKPHRASEYANMGAADFVRNLLLGSFAREEDAIRAYKTHWLEVEQAAAKAAAARGDGVAHQLESMLEAFLRAHSQNHRSSGGTLASAGVGGALYARFRRWLADALEESCAGDASASAAERATEDQLRRLQEFAKEHFEKGDSLEQTSRPASRCSVSSQAQSWRCSRCCMRNVGDAAACTACLQARPE